MDFVAAFNLAEALWWGGLGLALLLSRGRAETTRHRRCLAAVLLVFGASDLVEIRTGA